MSRKSYRSGYYMGFKASEAHMIRIARQYHQEQARQKRQKEQEESLRRLKRALGLESSS